MTYANILLETGDGIARLMLNRPEALNAMNIPLVEDMRDALRRVVADRSLRVLVITGAGRAFCAGADLAQPMMNSPEAALERGATIGREMDRHFNPLMRELAELPVPVLMAVNGVAAGGGASLAIAGDIAIAAESASLVFVFGPKLGLVPDLGATWHLPRLVGRARARGLALLGDKLPARKAADWGLIWDAVADADFARAVQSTAERLRDLPTKAFPRLAAALDRGLTGALYPQLDHERECQQALAANEDFAEGVAAFLAKRPPKFSGR